MLDRFPPSLVMKQPIIQYKYLINKFVLQAGNQFS